MLVVSHVASRHNAGQRNKRVQEIVYKSEVGKETSSAFCFKDALVLQRLRTSSSINTYRNEDYLSVRNIFDVRGLHYRAVARDLPCLSGGASADARRACQRKQGKKITLSNSDVSGVWQNPGILHAVEVLFHSRHSYSMHTYRGKIFIRVSS